MIGGRRGGSFLTVMVALTLLALAKVPSFAQNVEPGMWYDPSQGGRGYAIETQGSSLFVAAYVYDSAGRATWYASQGATTISGGQVFYSGPLEAYGGGHAINGSPRSPSDLGSIGSLTLQFTSSATARVTFTLGGTTGTYSIQRYAFDRTTVSPSIVMQGQWLFYYALSGTAATAAGATYADFANFAIGPGAAANTGGTGLIISSDGKWGSECYTGAGAQFPGQCLAVYQSGSFQQSYLFQIPINEIRGITRINSSTNVFKLFGRRVGASSSVTSVGLSSILAVPTMAAPLDINDDAAQQTKIAADRRSGAMADDAAFPAGPEVDAIVAALRALPGAGAR